jgi:hypothetical protein
MALTASYEVEMLALPPVLFWLMRSRSVAIKGDLHLPIIGLPFD